MDEVEPFGQDQAVKRSRPLPLLAAVLAWVLALALAPALAQVAPEPMHRDLATPILGHAVLDPAGTEVARVIDVLVDNDGAVRAAVLEFGGFLGVGQRRIAVAWRALMFSPADQRITLLLDPEQIAAMPEYKEKGAPILVVTPATPP